MSLVSLDLRFPRKGANVQKRGANVPGEANVLLGANVPVGANVLLGANTQGDLMSYRGLMYQGCYNVLMGGNVPGGTYNVHG